MTNLGFVGLGVMGGQMVSRLLSKGHGVTGYNRTRSKAQWLTERGMKWADSPRAVAAAADVTFAMVTNSAALESIACGPDGLLAGLGKGKVFVDISTVSPGVSRTMAAKVRERGADMVDAPVSGSTSPARTGKRRSGMRGWNGSGSLWRDSASRKMLRSLAAFHRSCPRPSEHVRGRQVS